MPLGADHEAIEKIALRHAKVKEAIGNKVVRKIIVAERFINIVVT